MKRNISESVCVLLFICVFVCFTLSSKSESEKEDTLDLKIERVALFKNGLGFFSSSGKIPGKATRLRIGQLPIPSFGTFWVGYSEGIKNPIIVSEIETFDDEIPTRNIRDLLQANVGSKVVLSRARSVYSEKETIEGTILKIEPVEPLQPPSQYFMDTLPYSDARSLHGNINYSNDMVLLETDTGIVAININSIDRADFQRKDIIRTAKIKLKRPNIRMELKESAKGETVSISYLSRGISWAPGYLIDLSDPQTARFTARALVINEVANLDNVTLDLVTGYPNIIFSDVISPVSMIQDLSGFLKSLTTGRSEQGRRSGRDHMITQQSVTTNAFPYDRFEEMLVPSYSTASGGTVSEDLFLYPVENFTLKKGETAYVPLFSAEMPYKHIYTWKIPDLMDKEEGNYNQSQNERPDGKETQEVWHSCRLVNGLDIPLTTSPAEFIKDGKFVGQDVCYYTSPKGETTIRINRAMNILAEQAEFEMERQRDIYNFQGYQYDQVKLKGELKLINKLDKSANIEIVKDLSGEVVEKNPDAKDVQLAKGLKKVNPRHQLTWEIELASGEEKIITYVYQVYVRR